MRPWILSGLLVISFAAACATSPLGRKQLMLVDDDTMNQMGAKAFQEVGSQTPEETNPAIVSYVHCVAEPITRQASSGAKVSQWDIKVFKSDQANAFALPGGKVGVYTGMLKVAKTPDQLAAVIGHEIGHVIARHGAERVSEQTLEGGALGAASAFITGGGQPTTTHTLIMAALGVGAQLGLALPHSRTQESEADIIGENLMAQTGFDPAEAPELWRNMASAGGAQPPQWLSTHPANQSRIDALNKNLPEAKKIYQQAGSLGRSPRCKSPSV
jgi:predicted Zn-dependent protease